MGVYVLAQLRFTDLDRYREYQQSFPAVFAKSPGSLLAADEAPVVLDGEWDRDKVVLLEFASESDAREFLESPAYQKISKDREAGAETLSLMVRGL